MTLKFFVRMSVLLVVSALIGITPLAAESSFGGLVPDAAVTLMDGSTVAAQDLTVGSKIWTWDSSKRPSQGTVTGIRRFHTDNFIELKAGAHRLGATGSHRVATSETKLVRLDSLKVGDRILLWGTRGAENAVVTSIRNFPITLSAFDLTTENDRLFQVDGIVVGD